MSRFLSGVQNHLPLILSFLAGGLTLALLLLWYLKPHRRGYFASHSSEDRPIVRHFWQALRLTDATLIRDSTHVMPGDDAWNQIFRLIRRSKGFFLFWSPNALGNANVEREWKYALSLKRNRFVRVVCWDNASRLKIPDELSRFSYEFFEFNQLRSVTPDPWQTLRTSPSVGVVLLIVSIALTVAAATFLVSKRIERSLKAPERAVPSRRTSQPEQPHGTAPPSEQSPARLENTPSRSKSRVVGIAPLAGNSGNPLAQITYFRIQIAQAQHRMTFEAERSYEAGTEFRLVWGVRNSNSVTITPHVIPILPDEGEMGIVVIPEKTTTYILEAIGADKLAVQQKLTIKVLERERPKPATVGPPRIILEARTLTEQDLIENQQNNLNDPPYGKLCYQVINVTRATIFPGIGEVAPNSTERCIFQYSYLVKNSVFRLDATTANNRLVSRETSFRMNVPEPEVDRFDARELSRTQSGARFEVCYKTSNVRYLVIKVLDLENHLVPKRVLATVNPSSTHCFQDVFDVSNYFHVIYVGHNGSSSSFDYKLRFRMR